MIACIDSDVVIDYFDGIDAAGEELSRYDRLAISRSGVGGTATTSGPAMRRAASRSTHPASAATHWAPPGRPLYGDSAAPSIRENATAR